MNARILLALSLAAAWGCGSPSEAPPAPPVDAPPAAVDGSEPAPGTNPPPADVQDIKFQRFIEEGAPTVTIRGTVEGASKGRVDFTQRADDGGSPRALHVEDFTGGTFTVTAPATFESPIYVTAVALDKPLAEGELPLGGGLRDPIKLEGKDLTISITIGENVELHGVPAPGGAAPAPAAPAPAEPAPVQ